MNKQYQNILALFLLLLISNSLEIYNGSNSSKNKSKKSVQFGGSLLQLVKNKDILTQSEFDSKVKNKQNKDEENNIENTDNISDLFNKHKTSLLATKNQNQNQNQNENFNIIGRPLLILISSNS